MRELQQSIGAMLERWTPFCIPALPGHHIWLASSHTAFLTSYALRAPCTVTVQCTPEGCQLTGFKLRILMVCSGFWGNDTG
eukprot:1144077-Pelagomonas_calceolata.AAC.8